MPVDRGNGTVFAFGAAGALAIVGVVAKVARGSRAMPGGLISGRTMVLPGRFQAVALQDEIIEGDPSLLEGEFEGSDDGMDAGWVAQEIGGAVWIVPFWSRAAGEDSWSFQFGSPIMAHPAREFESWMASDAWEEFFSRGVRWTYEVDGETYDNRDPE